MTKEQKTLKKLNNQGYALVLVIIIVALVVTLAGSMIFALNTELRLNQSAEEKERANYLAQAGVEHFLAYLEKNSNELPSAEIEEELGTEGDKKYKYKITKKEKEIATGNIKFTSEGIIEVGGQTKLTVTINATININSGVVSLDVSE